MSTWQCPTCTARHSELRGHCVRCGLARPARRSHDGLVTAVKAAILSAMLAIGAISLVASGKADRVDGMDVPPPREVDATIP
jgi:hypothetical protein